VATTSKAHNVKVHRERQDMNLPKLIERFGSEDRCRAYLETLRWPEGVRCPDCGSDSISRIKAKVGSGKDPGRSRNQYDCNGCRSRFSVKSGTVFHDSHLPLWKWFLATYLITESKKGISANQLKRTLGVSYKTAWYLCHRIRSAMTVSDPGELSGVVEVDETYVGGRARRGSRKAQGQGGGTHHKTMVLGALERGGKLRVTVEHRRGGEVLRTFVLDTIEEDSTSVYTDGHSGYRSLADHGIKHETVDHSAEEWVRGDVSTQGIESAWSLFKRSIVGSYHQLSAKHLQSYVDEFAFRFNNRENPYLFRDTLIALVCGDILTYDDLTHREAAPS
jgi:transposase-like protein